MSATTEKLALFNNAVSMAFWSFTPELGTTVPVNFTNGRNVTPKNEQDHNLLVVAAIEGYKSHLWATPKQISSVGGVVPSDAVRVPVEIKKKSSKGNEFSTSYEVVNFEVVSWPNGMSSDLYDRIVSLMTNPKHVTCEYDFPAPTPIPARNVIPTPTPIVKNTKPSRSAGNLSLSEKQHVGPEGKHMPNVVCELKEFGIRVEARTLSEAQIMLDSAVKAYIACKK